MAVKPALNPQIKDVATSLIVAGRFTKDSDVPVWPFDKMTPQQRSESALGIDQAILPEYEQHYLLPIMALVNGELVLSEKALEGARDSAYENNFDEMAVAARALLNELSMRTKPQPITTEDDRPTPRRPALAMSDYVSWPSVGAVMHGRIETVHISGQVKPHKDHPGLTASKDAPIAVIRVYDKDRNGWAPSDRKVVRPLQKLTKIGSLARPKGANLFEVRNKGKLAEILIYSDIGDEMWGGLSGKEFRRQVDELKNVDELSIRINSGGGDAFEGMAIYNTLVQHKSHKVVHIDGIAASIATVIAMAGDVIYMAEASEFMIHRSWTMMMGNINELKKAMERLELTDKIIAGVYNKRTGQSERDLLAMMDEETWFSPAEAKEYGFIDEISERQVVAASFRRDWFKKGPNVVDFDAADRSRRQLLARGKPTRSGS